jgi:hypothetical protein
MRRGALCVVLACLVVYHVNGKPQPEVDCVAAPYAAWSLVRHGSFDLGYYPELSYLRGDNLRPLADGAWVSVRPPGTTLSVAPLVAPFALFSERPLQPCNMMHLGKLAGALSAALAAGLFFGICRRLFPGAEWPATLLFALGTCLWSVASQSLWMHGPATLWLCLALYLQSGPRADRGGVQVLAGLALGMAVVTRPTTAVFAVAGGLLLVGRRQWRQAAWLTLGGSVPVAWLCLLNGLQFGNPFMGGYVHDTWEPGPPWWLGLSGLLIAPSRGLFVYSPALVLAPWGAWLLLWRRETEDQPQQGLLLAWLGASLVTLLLYARWHEWAGGWCFGPRYLCETMPVWCLLFAAAYRGLGAAWKRRAAEVLVALSVTVHFVGVFGHRAHPDWQLRHTLHDQGRCLFALHDTQIEVYGRGVFRRK